MQIFRVNFYEPLRFFYFWSDDFIMAIARFLFCTLAFSLLVKQKISVAQFSDFYFFDIKMVNIFFSYRTAIQELGSDYF